jgi:hypothetical protein
VSCHLLEPTSGLTNNNASINPITAQKKLSLLSASALGVDVLRIVDDAFGEFFTVSLFLEHFFFIYNSVFF